MAVRITKRKFDFAARDYKTKDWSTEILSATSDLSKVEAQPGDKNNFVQRWYLSLQGEENPVISPALVSKGEAEQHIYRYDWAFGITLIEGFWWNWQAELREESAIVIHLLFEEIGDAPDLVPIGGTLSALRPSRNTKGVWETAWPQIPKVAANLANVGKVAVPQLEYASTGLIFASNVLESYTDKEKNWFLYQFFDEKLKCPTVEWRISRRVLIEYGPLLRGTLYAVFYGTPSVHSGAIRVQLRPGIGYFKGDDLSFIRPMHAFNKDQQVHLQIKPTEVTASVT